MSSSGFQVPGCFILGAPSAVRCRFLLLRLCALLCRPQGCTLAGSARPWRPIGWFQQTTCGMQTVERCLAIGDSTAPWPVAAFIAHRAFAWLALGRCSAKMPHTEGQECLAASGQEHGARRGNRVSVMCTADRDEPTSRAGRRGRPPCLTPRGSRTNDPVRISPSLRSPHSSPRPSEHILTALTR